jgi:hypothetical protein
MKAWIAKAFGMTDQAWRRHANPWSVYTRFAAIPAMILAIWSRVWIGWWALVAVAAVIMWLWLNPHVFPAVNAAVRAGLSLGPLRPAGSEDLYGVPKATE